MSHKLEPKVARRAAVPIGVGTTNGQQPSKWSKLTVTRHDEVHSWMYDGHVLQLISKPNGYTMETLEILV